MTFHVDGRDIPAVSGTVLHIPRMTPHTFKVESEETRILNWYAPAGSELHVISLARLAEERRRPTMAEGPPPESDEQNQILSRLYGSVAVSALPFSVPPSEALLATPPDEWTVGDVHVSPAPADRDALTAFGSSWRFLAGKAETDGCYDLAEATMPGGTSMPRRMLGSDEAIYLLNGEILVDADGRDHVLKPGGFDAALAANRGRDDLAVAWLESDGTRFIEPLPAHRG